MVLLYEPEKRKASGILVSQFWLANVSKIDQKQRKRREKSKLSCCNKPANDSFSSLKMN